MGFEEFAQKSLQNNRGLIKNVVHKYFRKQSSPAANEKTDLSPVRNKMALQRRAQQITDQYILFFVIVVIIVVLLAVFLGRRGF